MSRLTRFIQPLARSTVHLESTKVGVVHCHRRMQERFRHVTPLHPTPPGTCEQMERSAAHHCLFLILYVCGLATLKMGGSPKVTCSAALSVTSLSDQGDRHARPIVRNVRDGRNGGCGVQVPCCRKVLSNDGGAVDDLRRHRRVDGRTHVSRNDHASCGPAARRPANSCAD